MNAKKPTATRWLKEYRAGRQSGLLHNDSDPLCQDNLRKMQLGIKNDVSLVRAYWKGYKTGYNERNK
jgi:hypothetical protein